MKKETQHANTVWTTKPNTKKKKKPGIRFWYDPKTLPRYANDFLESNLHQTLLFRGIFSYDFNSNVHMRQKRSQLRLATEVGYGPSVKRKVTVSRGKWKWAGMRPRSRTELCFVSPKAEFQVSHSTKGYDLKYLEVRVHSQSSQNMTGYFYSPILSQ